MALDSILTPVIPLAHGSSGLPSKSTTSAARGSSSNNGLGFDSVLNSVAGHASDSGGSGESHSDSSIGAGSGTGSGSGTNAGTREAHHARGSNGAGSGADGSTTAGAKHPSADSTDSSNANGKGTGSRSGSRSSGANSRSKQSSSQTQGASANAAANAANKSAGAKAAKASATAQQDGATPAAFLQALAQSQANAAQNAADAATGASAASSTSEATSAAGGKTKEASDDDANASPSSLAFISQSLAAAMAGQQPISAQGTVAGGSAAADSDADEGSTDAISSAGSSGGSAVQTLMATLSKDTADALKAAGGDGSSAAGGSKTDTPTNTAPTADGTSAAVSAFQAHMSVGSQFQQPAPDNANKVSAAVGSQAFNDEFSGKVTWLANQGIQSASVQLSPEHLGPVSVHISVQDGTASVSFNAAHADTRAALEQALPRLREMFATNGLTLSDANVSHQSPRGQGQKQSVTAIGSGRGASNDATSSTVTTVAVSRLGLVDTYA